jgi:hypothetical protein
VIRSSMAIDLKNSIIVMDEAQFWIFHLLLF